MFTGIIEEIGTLRRVIRSGQAMLLTIGAKTVLQDVQIGDSIAVNGVCLTVVSYDSDSFTADVMPETYRQTNLSELTIGGRVNLERAMAAGKRFGGHIVQGHVDTTGVITGRRPEDNAVVFTIKPDDPAVLRYMIPRGSIAIDGISLTLIRVTDEDCSVSIIPHTLSQTVLNDKQPGDKVNLECDVLGKYVERLLENIANRPQAQGARQTPKGVTLSMLAENGFL